ncbi:MAG: hypothetical protein FJ279_11865, partial [Planctomycetes bacterium]|nr:hypothetical protein [Planctomycetota bacterium]
MACQKSHQSPDHVGGHVLQELLHQGNAYSEDGQGPGPTWTLKAQWTRGDSQREELQEKKTMDQTKTPEVSAEKGDEEQLGRMGNRRLGCDQSHSQDVVEPGDQVLCPVENNDRGGVPAKENGAEQGEQ